MHMSVRGVIFDLGSTLIYRTGLELEKEKCGVLAQYAAAEWGCRDPQTLAARLLEIRLDGWRRSEEDLIEVLATDSIAEAFKAMALPVDETIVRRAEAVFFEPEVRISGLYPGAVETLKTLRAMGLQLGMISNATSHALILDITGKHRIGEYFDPVVSSAGYGRVKPHPAIFTHVLDLWGIAAQSAVMIGDNLHADIQGAGSVGMRSILVDIEPHPGNAAFAGAVTPTARITVHAEIPRLIKQWAAG